MNAHDVFVKAIHDKKKVLFTFFSDEDGCVITRKCAPYDYGVMKKRKDGIPRYCLWDYQGKKGPHPLFEKGTDVRGITATDESFDPSEFVTWSTSETPFMLARDWSV